MKYGFIGGTPRGYKVFLELVAKGYRPEFCVILKEDDHENLKVSGDFLKEAEKNNIPASVKKKLNAQDYANIQTLDLDFLIVCGWRTLIEPDINQYLKIGMVAAHDSLLPEYRGFAPLNWAIINGETETGVTLFLINDGETDSGEIITAEKVSIGPDETAPELYEKIIDATVSAYLKLIEDYQRNPNINLIVQDENLATYTCKRTPDDGRIDWYAGSNEVYNLIRALIYPYSGAFFYHNDQKYIVRSARMGFQNHKVFSGRIPGRVISVLENGIEVLCGSGSVFIGEIELASSGVVVAANSIFKSITTKLL
jgi:methionyl-tRNA formyltransferase